MFNMSTIGDYIKKERKKAGLTQEDFAIRSGLGLRFVRELEQGVDIGGYRTKPCTLKMQSPTEGTITLTEGKYHQIKRMFQNRCNRVIALERISFGGLWLDGRLAPGEFRFLTKEEEALLGAEN